MTKRLFLTLLSVSLPLRLVAQAQPHHEIALDYTFVRANAPPGDCGCFSLNGGSGSYAYHFNPKIALVGEIGGVHAAQVDGSGLDLTLTSYLAGPRFFYRRANSRLTPYGQVLIGAARATGGLAPANSNGASSSGAFAAAVGGGLEYKLRGGFTLRLPGVDYSVSTFENKVNGHQNNLRVTAGAAYHFGH